MKLHIQVININNLAYTKNLIDDLLKQTHQFQLTLIDQGSTEPGTKEYFKSLREVPYIDTEFIQNDRNVDLNRLWNRLYENSSCLYLCFLNNDMRISRNFVEDTVNIFEREKSVGIVIHATNHKNFQKVTKLNYIILQKQITQGWDFAIRKEAYVPIPDDLKVFGGDDWLFTQMYRKLWKTAVALSSPIIHYRAKSHKFYKGDRKTDMLAATRLGIDRLSYFSRYSRRNPCFKEIIEGDYN